MVTGLDFHSPDFPPALIKYLLSDSLLLIASSWGEKDSINKIKIKEGVGSNKYIRVEIS